MSSEWRTNRKFRKPGQPLPLAGLVASIYPAREPAELHALRAFAWWDKAVPERVAMNARPVRMYQGVLYVHARTAAWVQNLEFVREQLLHSVQKNAPRAGVKGIKVRVGKLPELPIPPRLVVHEPHEPLTTLPSDVEAAVASVKDPGVRGAVWTAAAMSLARPVVVPAPIKPKRR